MCEGQQKWWWYKITFHLHRATATKTSTTKAMMLCYFCRAPPSCREEAAFALRPLVASSPIGGSLCVCVCVCARAQNTARRRRRRRRRSFVSIPFNNKGKRNAKRNAKKKKKISHSIKLSLYRRATNADEGRRTTKAAATRA